MEITPARKLLSYVVSLMLLCVGKLSYDHHRPPLPLQDSPFKVIVDSKVLPPPTAPVAPATQEKTAADFVVVKDGKTLNPATSAAPTPDKSE